MKALLKHTAFLFVVAVYLIGTAGFKLSHCCCSKSFNVIPSLIDAYKQISYKDNHMHVEDLSDSSCTCSFKQRKCCGDSVYSMDGVNYSNEDVLSVPMCNFVELLTLLPVEDDTLLSGYDVKNFEYCDLLSLEKLRRVASPDLLCTFLC